ncbi:MAG: ABC transporter ATP-binding protein, partial [Candidatus Limivicinus sp.]
MPKMPGHPGGKAGQMGGKGFSADLAKNFSSLGRVIRKLFSYYPRLAPLTVFCILFSAVVSAIPSLFVQKVLAVVEELYVTRDWASARPEIVHYLVILAVLYLLSLIAMTFYTQIMAYMTQGFLDKLRREMFDGMQGLPLRYFDTHAHGDIMSHYTNDIDTLRQLVSQALPNLIQSGAVVLAVFAVMLWFSLWLTLVLVLGIVAMFFTTKVIGGGSARYFMRQQEATGAMEGLAQELMSGQKVIKVFNHEEACIQDFNAANDELFQVSRKANTYAGLLGPIMANIGNLLYV